MPVQTGNTVASEKIIGRRHTKGSLILPNHTFIYNFRLYNNKMAQEKTRMPMSTAGITTYFEDYHSKIEFKPGHIIVFSIIVILAIVALHIWGQGILA